MVIEEKIIHKDIHLKQIIDEYTFLKDKYMKGIIENQDETLNENKISTNAEVLVYILEAVNLLNEPKKGDFYVTVSIENKLQSTSTKDNSVNPVWNEDFAL